MKKRQLRARPNGKLRRKPKLLKPQIHINREGMPPPREDPTRTSIRSVRKAMRKYAQYKDRKWFWLRKKLDDLYLKLPANLRAR